MQDFYFKQLQRDCNCSVKSTTYWKLILNIQLYNIHLQLYNIQLQPWRVNLLQDERDSTGQLNLQLIISSVFEVIYSIFH